MNIKDFLEIARGSQYELQTQLQICVMLNYLKKDDLEDVFFFFFEIGKMLNSIIKKLNIPNP